MSFLPNCIINIYKSSDKTNAIWTGTTDTNGKAIDVYGQPPNLRYGEYIAVAEHCDYDREETVPFTVPETKVIPMSIGCTSSISTHESTYDHSKLISGLAFPSGLGPFPYLGTTPPSGWLLCNGAAISRTTYAGLFSVIGTTCGSGDGITTFNLPDMRGRVPAGIGASGIINLGSIGGEQNHILTTSEMPAHTHIQDAHNHTINMQGQSLSAVTGGASPYVYGTGAVTNITTATNQNTGGGETHNNMPPYLGVNYIISI